MANTQVTSMSDASSGVAAYLYAVQSGDKKILAVADAVSFLLGTTVTTAAPMGALAIDVTKRLNTKTVAADATFTFSGTPAASNQWFGMLVTNSDGSAHTLTIPSSFSISRAGTITSVIIPASGKLYLVWCYDGSVYNLFGDPPVTIGTGSSFVVSSGSLSGFTGLKVATKQTASNYTVGTTDSNELWGGVIEVTAACTITLPAVQAGMSFSITTTGDVAVSADPNASDLIVRDGVAQADGEKITNLSTSGDIATFTARADGTGWIASTNGWTNGG